MYGGRQIASLGQGWIGWFVQKAIETGDNEPDRPFTINGSGKEDMTGAPLNYTILPARENDRRVFVADNRKAQDRLLMSSSWMKTADQAI